MEYWEINRLVSREIPPAHTLSLPDMLCYEALCILKREYETAGLDMPETKRRKQKIKNAYQSYKEAYEAYLENMKGYQANIKRAGGLRNDILKGIGKKADRELLLDACRCIGLMTGDESFWRLCEKSGGYDENR